MDDIGTPIEQGLIMEQEPRPVIALVVPLQEPILPQRGQINIESFYKDEVARRKIEQSLSSHKAWQVIEKAAADNESIDSEKGERQVKPRSIEDRVHRQALLVHARLEGVSDLVRFQELADYLESTVYKSEDKHVKVPKRLSDEQMKKVVEAWKAKGWQETYNIYEHQGDKQENLSLNRWAPLRLERKHIRLIKSLISVDNDPRELAEGLQKIGFGFSEDRLMSPDEMKKLSEFFIAPHAKEALELANGISRWDNGLVGRLEFLTQLAQSPDPKVAFSPELAQKVDILSRALGTRVGVAQIGQFREIMSNPDYLEFVAYLTKLGGASSYRERVPVFENIMALDQAGMLKPVVDLYRSGVSIETSNDYFSQDTSLKKLFDSYEALSRPRETQQEAVRYLQEKMALPEVKSFLGDAQRQEFVGLLGDLRGFPLAVGDLSSLDKLFGDGIARGKEAIFVLKTLQGIKKDGGYSISLDTLASVVSNSYRRAAFTDKEFPKFLEALESKTGYRPTNYDLFFEGSSKLADAFNNPVIRQGLVQDSTTEVIKAIGGGINLYRSGDYIRLGNNPNMVSTIIALKGVGCELSDPFGLPKVDILEDIANNSEALNKLEFPELKSLAARLAQEFGWKATVYQITDLIELYDDKELQRQLFIPENSNFIKIIEQNRLSLFDVRPILNLDSARRDLLVDLVSKFNYYPDFSSYGKGVEQQEMLTKLIQHEGLRNKLFSANTQEIFKKLKDFGYYRLDPQDIETIANAPSNFPDFIAELKDKYKYSFQSKDLIPLLQLLENKEGLNGLLDTLANHDYRFKVEDISSILQLVPYTERLSATVATLNEVMGYKFDIHDSKQLAFIIEEGYTKERLIDLKQIHDKYKDQSSSEFSIGAIQNVIFVEEHEDTIARLESYNYKFNLQHIEYLRSLFELSDKDTIFQTLDILRDNLSFSYNPKLSQYYVRLAQIPGIGEKLREAGVSVAKEDVMQENNFKLFVALRADAALYNHARKLITDDYFRNIRDAKNRFEKFNRSMLSGEIPDAVLARIFTVSGKATELDRIALKYGINAEIARAAQNTDWQGLLLQAENFQEANEALTKMMTDLAIPVIYVGLEGEELSVKQNELIKLAGKDKEFDDILEINCRVVGIYGQKYSNKNPEYGVLMGAIRQSLELNLERNPRGYLEKRAELSKHQFDRVFESVPQDVRDRAMRTWLDLAPRRKLRVSGDVVTAEEATLSRLNRIRDIVHSDLSVHLQGLFATKIKELKIGVEKGETNGPGAEQLAIYKQYLMTPEGVTRQDVPMMYRSVETFIRNAQAALKNPQTSREEKGKLGKSLGTYQGIADSLKALYRLGTISEERYKARRDYLNEIEKHIGEFSGALKRLKILDPDRRSAETNTRVLEEEVLLDFGKLKGAMAEENISGQTVFETESTVDFRNLARAPEITQSCQRLTEATDYNHAAYSRLLDGSNEMIDIFEMRNGERNRLARSFVELSKVRLTGEDQSRLVILIDREYVNPQYQNFGNQFSSEMMLHMLDRLSTVPELSLIFDSNRFTANPDVQDVLRARGYQLKQVSGDYFINESNVKLAKYYDSLGGVNNVAQSFWKPFSEFFIIEKV